MSTTESIRQHLRRLDEHEMFTTRDMLNYGTRNSVDQALYRMVEKGIIVRLARGVFIQNHEDLVIPSDLEVAEVKARAFFKKLYTTGKNAAKRIGLIRDDEDQSSITFNTNGPTSSFKYLEKTTVRFKSMCTRKLHYEDRPVGLVIRALWYLGEQGLKALEPSMINRAMSYMSRDDREAFRASGAVMPHWMVTYFFAKDPGRLRRALCALGHH